MSTDGLAYTFKENKTNFPKRPRYKIPTTMSTKRHRLLKKLPEAEAGTVFIWDEKEGIYINENRLMFSSQTGKTMMCGYRKQVVENNPEWFSLIEGEEKKEFQWTDSLAMELCEYVGLKFDKTKDIKLQIALLTEKFKSSHQSIKEEQPKRPPLGIIPEWLWREQRMNELRSAINRYDFESKPREKSWVDECSQHMEWLHNYRENRPKEKRVEKEDFREWVGHLVKHPSPEQPEERLRWSDRKKRDWDGKGRGKEYGTPFERLAYWGTHSGWKYCQGGERCGNEPIIKLSHFEQMVSKIEKETAEQKIPAQQKTKDRDWEIVAIAIGGIVRKLPLKDEFNNVIEVDKDGVLIIGIDGGLSNAMIKCGWKIHSVKRLSDNDKIRPS